VAAAPSLRKRRLQAKKEKKLLAKKTKEMEIDSLVKNFEKNCSSGC
jgi:hypothetical protein